MSHSANQLLGTLMRQARTASSSRNRVGRNQVLNECALIRGSIEPRTLSQVFDEAWTDNLTSDSGANNLNTYL